MRFLWFCLTIFIQTPLRAFLPLLHWQICYLPTLLAYCYPFFYRLTLVYSSLINPHSFASNHISLETLHYLS